MEDHNYRDMDTSEMDHALNGTSLDAGNDYMGDELVGIDEEDDSKMESDIEAGHVRDEDDAPWDPFYDSLIP